MEKRKVINMNKMKMKYGNITNFRGSRALGARAKHALGTREACAFAGFNEHPLVYTLKRCVQGYFSFVHMIL